MSQMCQIVSSHERIVCIFMKMLSKIRNIKKIYRIILRKVRKYMRNPMFLFLLSFSELFSFSVKLSPNSWAMKMSLLRN